MTSSSGLTVPIYVPVTANSPTFGSDADTDIARLVNRLIIQIQLLFVINYRNRINESVINQICNILNILRAFEAVTYNINILPDIKNTKNLEVLESIVEHLIVEDNKIKGVAEGETVLRVLGTGTEIVKEVKLTVLPKEYKITLDKEEYTVRVTKYVEPIVTLKNIESYTLEIADTTKAVVEDNKRKAPSVDKYKKMAQRNGKLFSKQPFRWLMKRTWGKKLLFLFFGKKKDTKTAFPTHLVSKTDQERCENMTWVLKDKTPFIVTQKCDGSSGTYILERKGFRKYEFYICINISY